MFFLPCPTRDLRAALSAYFLCAGLRIKKIGNIKYVSDPFKQGYKDSNLEVLESESSALPFGDSPMFFCDHLADHECYYNTDGEKLQAFFQKNYFSGFFLFFLLFMPFRLNKTVFKIHHALTALIFCPNLFHDLVHQFHLLILII